MHFCDFFLFLVDDDNGRNKTPFILIFIKLCFCMALIDLFLFFQGYFINTLRPIQNGRNFVDNIFTYFLLKEVLLISIKISLNFVPKDLIINITALVHIMDCCHPGDKSLCEPMRVRLLTHIYVTWPRWVNAPGQSCITPIPVKQPLMNMIKMILINAFYKL